MGHVQHAHALGYAMILEMGVPELQRHLYAYADALEAFYWVSQSPLMVDQEIVAAAIEQAYLGVF